MTKTTVAIVDDHEAIRLGFQLTAVEAGFDLVASCSTVAELVEKCAGKMPQVVILDLSLADGSQPAENVRNLIAAGSQVFNFLRAPPPHPPTQPTGPTRRPSDRRTAGSCQPDSGQA